jgi:S1-C subfamily serine protease
VLVLVLGRYNPPAAMDSTLAPAYRALPSLVFVRAEIPARHPTASILGEERMGSGVAAGVDVVVTAHYLVLGARKIQLQGADGHKRTVRHTAIDHESGLAVLSVEGHPLRPAALAEGPVRPGTPIFMLTCTGEREWKGATGHVMQVGPFEAFWEYMLDGAIMTTAVNPGLAGAPLFDAHARTLGVVTLGLAAVGRYSLAIPIDLYLRRRQELDSGQMMGSVHAWVGVYPQNQDGGVALTGVVPGGPAEKSGLQRGDVILSVDGETVSTLRELYQAIRRKGPGQGLSFQVLRDSAIRVVEVTAGDRDVFYR